MKYLLAIALALAIATPVFAAEIIDYKMVCMTDGIQTEAPGIANLNIAIRNEIKNGWQPFGTVSISMQQMKFGLYFRIVTIYCQAMVKYKPEPTPTPTSTPTLSPGALP